MNVQLPVHMDKSAFLAWVQDREERYELVNGRVVMMTRASRAHAMIVRNLVVALDGQLDPLEWTVVADFGLDIGPKTLRFPDVMVERAGGSGRDYTASAPAVLVEVLSPSTARFDLGDKAAEFLRIPSLIAYVVFAQDEQKAWVWVRGSAAFPPGPEVLEGKDAVVPIVALGVNLPLSAVYARVDMG
jgi:Uma2 family endonuclease